MCDESIIETVLLGSTACLLLMNKNILTSTRQSNRKRKKYGVHPIFRQKKQSQYQKLIQEIRLSDPYVFYNFTRMSPSSYDKLLSIVGPHIVKHSLRKSISPGCRLMITLRFLAAGDSYPSLSHTFSIGITTICNIIRETLDILWEQLVPLVLRIPTENVLYKCAEEFCTKWSLPNCVGAIGGKHISIQATHHSGSFHYILLAVCDADYSFLFVDFGAYGSQSDGGVLNQSAFGKKLLMDKLNMPTAQELPYANDGIKIPFYFVGDKAFPLRDNLMRPFSKLRDGPMPEAEQVFNNRLSRVRLIIENTFGIMVARFRIFHRAINASPTTVDNIIKASVCLHNFIRQEKNELYFHSRDVDMEMNGKIIPGSWRSEIPKKNLALGNLVLRLGARNAPSSAIAIRNYLKDYVVGPGACLAS